MKIAGKSNTKSAQTIPTPSQTSQKNHNEFLEFIRECGEHFRKHRAPWAFTFAFIVFSYFSKCTYNKMNHLEEKYIELDKQVSVLESLKEANNDNSIVKCKLESLYQYDSKAINTKEFQKKYSDCSIK